MNSADDRTAGNRAASTTGWLNRVISLRAIAPLALLALILAFFNKMAFSNLILARGDTFLYFYPYWQAAADALRSGRIPLWNPDIFMGAPFLANSQAGFFYPLNWPVWLLFSTPYAVSASILVHVFIAAAGAYLAGRRTLALGRPAALFSAALFALGGYLTAQVEHVNQLQGLAWLPWFFAALAPLVVPRDAPLTRRDIARVIVAVGSLFALQLLAGHTQTAFISGVAVSLWLAVYALLDLSGLRRPDRSGILSSSILVLVGGVGLAALLAAVQLLPTLELAGQSSRQGGLPLNEVLSFSWHPLHLSRALLPSYGQALFTEYVAFLPLTAWLLVVVGVWVWRKNPAVLPWAILVIVAVVLAFGRFTPVYYLLGNLPGFDLFRAPARWLAVAALGLALLAGFGWQRLRIFATTEWTSPEARRTAGRGLVRPLLAAGIGLFALIIWGYAAGWLARFMPAGAEAPFAPPTGRALLGWMIELALACLLIWVILTSPAGRARMASFELMILAMAALWIGSRGMPYDRLTTPEAYFDLRPPQARLAALAGCAVPEQPCAVPPDRFLSLSDIFFDPGDLAEIESIYAGQLDEDALYDYLIAVKHKEVLSPNLSMVDHLPSIDGFDGGVLPLSAYTDLMRLLLPDGAETTDGRLREFLPAAPDARWLNLFNGRYLITDKTGDLWVDGVFFDRQHPARVAEQAITVTGLPPFEATELRVLADDPPIVDIKTTADEAWSLTPQSPDGDGLYRLPFPRPATIAEIALLPCPARECTVNALTLVDARDDTFQSVTLPPYRLIFSGDVKIYENTTVQPRAFMVYDWQQAADVPAAVDAMRDTGFDPARSAVVVGDSPDAEPPGDGRGAVDVLDYQPETVALRATSDSDGLLVLTDTYYPGWRVTVDGVPVPIRQVNGLFRGVFLPAGDHDVVFSFQPDSVRTGAVLTIVGIGLVFIVFGLIVASGSRGKRSSAE